MSSPVILHDRAKLFLRDTCKWWAENRSTEQAEQWFNGFVTALDSLQDGAERWPLAPENDAFPFEVRELHYGIGTRPSHRALFTIRPEMVYVFLIRHVAQRPVTPDDL